VPGGALGAGCGSCVLRTARGARNPREDVRERYIYWIQLKRGGTLLLNCSRQRSCLLPKKKEGRILTKFQQR